MAIAPDGRIVVVDTDNHRVQVFHPNGTFALAFGSYGSGDGEFYAPFDLAVAPDGRIVVAAGSDAEKQRLHVFHPNGTFEHVFDVGTRHHISGRYINIPSIAVVPAPALPTTALPTTALPTTALPAVPPGWLQGMIAVATSASNIGGGSIHVFHPNGAPAISFYGDEDRRIGYTLDVAVAPDGRIAVSDRVPNQYLSTYNDYRVQVFHPNGTFARIVASETSHRDSSQQHNIAFDPAGRLVVDNILLGHIHVFHPDGTRAFNFLWADNEIWPSNPSAVAAGPDGRIAGVDSHNSRIRVFHPDGTFALAFGSYGDGDGEFNRPNGIAFAPDGRIAVADTGNHRVQVFHPNGTFALAFGSLGVGQGQFSSPHAVAVAPDGRIAVAEGIGRIQVFHPDGTFAYSFVSGVSEYAISVGPVPPPSVGPVPPRLQPGMIVAVYGLETQSGYTERRIQAFRHDGTLYPASGINDIRPQTQGSAAYVVAFGPDGRIAVADAGRARIQVFHPDGTFAHAFGSRGGGQGQFDGLSPVAFGPDGRIAVADNGNHRVQVFHPNGTFALAFGSYGGGEGEFSSPYAVAVAPDGRIAVADAGRARIQVFHPDGTFAHAFGSRGGGQGQFDGLSPVAFGPDGRIAVADNGNHRVQVFHPNGTFALAFGSYGGAEFGSQLDISVGPDGRIAVADTGNDRIQVFHPNGTFALGFEQGNPHAVAIVPATPFSTNDLGGQPQLHAAVTFHGLGPGIIAVADTGNHRVQVFHPNGTPAYSFGSYGYGNKQLASPYAVAAGPDGRIVVADYGHAPVQVFHPNGTFALAFGSYGSGDGEFNVLSAVAAGPDGRIAVADTGNHRVQVFHPNGTFALGIGAPGYSLGQFYQPSSVAAGPDGRIAVADTGNHRVQVFHPNGTFALAFGSYGSGEGEFSSPHAVAVAPDGRIAVAEGIGRIQVFHPNGTFAHAFGSYGGAEFGSQLDISVGPDGRIVVADTGNHRVQVFHPNGTFALGIGAPGYSLGQFYQPSSVAVVPALPPGAVEPPTPNGTVTTPGNGTTVQPPPPPIIVTPPPPPPLNGTTVQPPPPIVIAPPPPGNGTGPSAPTGPVSIVVELDSGGGVPVNATLIGNDANLTINVAGLTGTMLDGTASSTVTFPPTETTVITSFAEVSFPPGVTASHVPADGMLALRISSEARPPDDHVQGALAYAGSGRVELQRIVEVGAGSSGPSSGGTPRVTFDQPVRILLEGQAGGRAFYIQGTGGAITPIDAACATDDTARVHRQLAGAGECQIDSDDGTDKIIHTYHLTLFGTVRSESGAPPPVVHTCSARLGMSDLGVSVALGEDSPAAQQELINSGSLPFAGVELEATPWYVDWGGSAPPPSVAAAAAGHLSLPASISVVFFDDGGFGYEWVAINEAVVARGLEGGDVASLGFVADLTPYDEVQGSALVQYVTYLAQCSGR